MIDAARETRLVGLGVLAAVLAVSSAIVMARGSTFMTLEVKPFANLELVAGVCSSASSTE
jgi:hypothetical protein